MPVSKKTKKTQPKRTNNKRANKQVKKEIRQAVDKLPGLIVEYASLTHALAAEQNLPPTEPEISPEKKFSTPSYYTQDERNKKIILGIIIFLFTAVIFVLWAWNLTTVFRDTAKNKEKNNPFQTARQNFSTIVETETSQKKATTEKEQAKLKTDVQNNLAIIISNLKKTLLTNTSTDNNNTTTIKN